MFKNKTIFLSIDLDYWLNINRLQKELRYILNNCSAPVKLFHEHHHTLNWINKNPCDVLLNVDYHSDLADDNPKGPPRLSCGTWGNHVKWRKTGKFVWLPTRYANYTEGWGVCCTSRGSGINKIENDPFKESLSGWEDRTEVIKSTINKIPLKQVKAIAICLSIDYCLWYGCIFDKHIEKVQKIIPIPYAWYKQRFATRKTRFAPLQRNHNAKRFHLTKD